MEWFKEILHALIEKYVEKSQREKALYYRNIVLEVSDSACKKCQHIDLLELYTHYGIDEKMFRSESPKNTNIFYPARMQMRLLATYYYRAKISGVRYLSVYMNEAHSVIRTSVDEVQVLTNTVLPIPHDREIFVAIEELFNDYYEKMQQQQSFSLVTRLAVLSKLHHILSHKQRQALWTAETFAEILFLLLSIYLAKDERLELTMGHFGSEKIEQILPDFSVKKCAQMGCDLHLMFQLPESLAQYKDSYILIKKNSILELYYINPTGENKKVKINDFTLFEKKINQIKTKDPTKLYLSKKQINQIITLNGGHIPQISVDVTPLTKLNILEMMRGIDFSLTELGGFATQALKSKRKLLLQLHDEIPKNDEVLAASIKANFLIPKRGAKFAHLPNYSKSTDHSTVVSQKKTTESGENGYSYSLPLFKKKPKPKIECQEQKTSKRPTRKRKVCKNKENNAILLGKKG